MLGNISDDNVMQLEETDVHKVQQHHASFLDILFPCLSLCMVLQLQQPILYDYVF